MLSGTFSISVRPLRPHGSGESSDTTRRHSNPDSAHRAASSLATILATNSPDCGGFGSTRRTEIRTKPLVCGLGNTGRTGCAGLLISIHRFVTGCGGRVQLVTRAWAVIETGKPYEVRDTDGTPLDQTAATRR